MARTKASVGAKVASGKSSKARCSVAPSASSGGGSASERSSKSSSGGNPVCPRETPKWQKPITNFFICKDENHSKETKAEENEDSTAGSSKQKPKRNIIQSDDEEEKLTEKPINSVLEETLELEPLNGEDSHKIEEYYPKGGKGKGVGKKTKGKENRRDSKRERDGEEIESGSKRVKVN